MRSRRLGHRAVMTVGVLAVLVPGIALAHARLVRSTPAAGAHLRVAPRELLLVFSEAPELAVTRIELLAHDSSAVALGPLRTAPVSRNTVIADIRGPLVAGTYTVAWTMAGADGHPIRGRFTFTIEPGAEGLTAAVAPAESATAAAPSPARDTTARVHHDPVSMPDGDGFGTGSPAYVAIRWLQFIALLAVVGASAFRAMVLTRLRRNRGSAAPVAPIAGERAARVGIWAAAALAVITLARLYAQSYAMYGQADAMDARLVGTMLAYTVWGSGWLLQAGGTLAALLGFALARRASAAGWYVAGFASPVLAVGAALSGHAASSPRLVPLAVAADAAHVLGAGGWLGSLFIVVVAGVPAALALPRGGRGEAVADLVNAYSPTALASAGVLVVTGAFAAWLHVGTLPAFWHTSYGRVLLLKLAVLSVVAAVGAYNWLRVRPTLGDVEGASRIRRPALVELGIGALVLLVTAVLVATPPATEVEADRADVSLHLPAVVAGSIYAG